MRSAILARFTRAGRSENQNGHNYGIGVHSPRFAGRISIASRDAALAGPISPGAEISNSRRWSIVGLLFAASLINYVDRGTISVALPFIAHELHFGPEVKGILLSAFFWSYALMQVPVGWAVDHLNLKQLYIVMFLIWCASQGLTGLATGLGMLIAFRLLLGIGESIYFPGGIRIVSRLFAPKERGLPTGLFNCGIKAGLAVGAPLTALLISRYGWRHMFLMVGGVGLLWLIPWLLIFPLKLPMPRAEEMGDSGSRGAHPERRFVSLDRNLLGICLGYFCWTYYFYFFLTWLPDYLMTARHFSLLAAGFYAAVPYLVFMAGDPLGGWIADRLIRRGWSETIARKTVVTVAFSFALLLLPVTHVHDTAATIWLLAGASLVGFGSANTFVFPQCCAPENEIGIWTGFMNFIGSIGGIIAPLATGFLLERTGSYSPGFAIGALLPIAGILFYWFVLGELKPRSTGRARV